MTKLKEIKSCVNCTQKSSLFKLLNNSELELINDNRLQVKYRAGETIIKQGTQFTNFIVLCYGKAKVYLEGRNGKNLILRYLRPFEFISWPGAFTDNRHHSSVSAITESLVCLINVVILRKIIEQNNKFALGYIENVSRANNFSTDKLLTISQKRSHGRIAHSLLYLRNDVFDENTSGLSISRQELADIASMSKESVCRILKEFREGGIINLSNNSIKIVDLKLLKQISDFG
ncbi:hypothetical protein ES705_05104 [subsurface metagenome]